MSSVVKQNTCKEVFQYHVWGGEQCKREVGDEWAGGGGEGSGGRRRGGGRRGGGRGKIGEKGKEGKRGIFAHSKRGRRRQGGGSGGMLDAYPCPPLMYVEVCSVLMSFYAHAYTLNGQRAADKRANSF